MTPESKDIAKIIPILTTVKYRIRIEKKTATGFFDVIQKHQGRLPTYLEISHFLEKVTKKPLMLRNSTRESIYSTRLPRGPTGKS